MADSTDEGGEGELERTNDPGPRSSQTERERGLRSRRPRGTGDDPFTLGIDDDDNGYLKGDPPNAFDGDRSRTLTFLAEFNQYMSMNRKANLARDPVTKSAYFLSLMSSPSVEEWVFPQDVWLEKAEDDPTAWQTLEPKFKNDFETRV